MSVDANSGDTRTIIEKLNANDELFEAMLSMPTQMNEEMVESRREEVFSIFWEELSLERSMVLSHVRQRENDFIEEYSDVGEGLPNWLLRLEAQDVLLQVIGEELGV